jgi:FemAB-related protein (PEP-CTERM system-associated)
VLKRSFGHRACYLLAVSPHGEFRGVLPLAHVHSLLFGSALISTPFCVYGGILASDDAAHAALTRAACELARTLNVDHLEMRNRSRQHPDWQCKELYVTFRKPIDPDSEKNMLAIPRKQRAMVRKGMKEELRVEIDDDVARHYDIYTESLRNLGTPPFSRKYLRVLKEVFGENCDIVSILKGDRIVASVLNFYFREEVLPYYGGGNLEARAVAGNDFMYWSVMERARDRGCRTFDFGRSKRGTGAFDFKTYWGFEPEQLHYEYFLVKRKEMPNLSPTNPKYSRAIELWRRLPLKLTQLIGPPIAKYLG